MHVWEVIELFLTHNISSMPVVTDDERIEDILTKNDILNDLNTVINEERTISNQEQYRYC